MTASWTVDDKLELLKLLQEYGARDLELIQKRMPHKSIAEIRCICDKHKKLALYEWCCSESKKFLGDNVVIRDWLQILKQLNSAQKNCTPDIISRVLKYIALYEKRTDTSHVRLRDCYLVLSDISNGLASKYLDDSSSHFLFECLTKLAEALKNGEIESYKNHLRSLRSYNDLLKNQAETETKDSTTLNPLNVPDNLLKMTEVDKHVDILD